jgi:hypothetical protein
MKTIKPIIAACLFAALAAPVMAQNAMPRVDQRQANQERRIEQGEKSGALTDREASRMERGQAHVERMESRAEADGKVTAGERARLRQAENVESRRINQEKHDGQHDFNHDGRNDRSERRAARRAGRL